MKVAFVTNNLVGGGKERRLVELLIGLNKRKKIESILFLTDEKNMDNIAYKKVLDLPIDIYYLGGYNLFEKNKFIECIVKIEKVKLINTWAPSIYIKYLIFAKVFMHIPILSNSITNARSTFTFKERFLSNLSCLFCDVVLTNSKKAFSVFRVAKSKQRVIYNGFNYDRVKILKDKTVLKSSLNIKTKYIVSMVGRVSPAKDWTTFIRACNLLLDRKNDVTILCIGQGNIDGLKKLVNKKYFDRFKFLGFRDDVESLMNISTVSVLCSPGEGVSNSILESMALGVPVVATDTGGTPEIVEDKSSGYLVKYGDYQGVCEKVEYLLKNETCRVKMSKRCVDIVCNKFSIQQMIEKFESEFLKYEK